MQPECMCVCVCALFYLFCYCAMQQRCVFFFNTNFENVCDKHPQKILQICSLFLSSVCLSASLCLSCNLLLVCFVCGRVCPRRLCLGPTNKLMVSVDFRENVFNTLLYVLLCTCSSNSLLHTQTHEISLSLCGHLSRVQCCD